MSDLQKLVEMMGQKLYQTDSRVADPKPWDEMAEGSRLPYYKMGMIAMLMTLKAIRQPSGAMIQAGCKSGWPEFPMLRPEMQKTVAGMVQGAQQAGIDVLIQEIERGAIKF